MTRTVMKTLFAVVALAAATTSARAAERGAPMTAADAARADMRKTFGFTPDFFLRFPDAALPGLWDEMKGLQMNPHTMLPGKVKELIGLGVAAQIPCRYCIYGHTQFAKLGGATDAEIGEAVAMAGITRHWSAFLNGVQTDESRWRAEVARMVENARKSMAAGAAAPKPIAVVDGQSALRDVSQTLGFVPEFVKLFPEAARAGAWRELKEVELNPSTALSGKDKELIGLGVASQIPCRFCIAAHTEFARLAGASDAEINEAIAMASLTRNMSTLLNGLQIDEAQQRRDVDRLVKGARAAAKMPSGQRHVETANR